MGFVELDFVDCIWEYFPELRININSFSTTKIEEEIK
jgi:hypothetical protein